MPLRPAIVALVCALACVFCASEVLLNALEGVSSLDVVEIQNHGGCTAYICPVNRWARRPKLFARCQRLPAGFRMGLQASVGQRYLCYHCSSLRTSLTLLSARRRHERVVKPLRFMTRKQIAKLGPEPARNTPGINNDTKVARELLATLPSYRYEIIVAVNSIIILFALVSSLTIGNLPGRMRRWRQGFWVLLGRRTYGHSRVLTTHHLLKAYAVMCMLADHCGKVVDVASEFKYLLTLPAASGGALIFYFLIGANSKPEFWSVGVTGLLVLHLFMESVLFELPEITFETLVTIAFLRFVLPRIDLRTTGRAVFVAVAFGTCHILFGPWGFGILSYGGASLCFGLAGSLTANGSAKAASQAWAWLALGTAFNLSLLVRNTLIPAEIGLFVSTACFGAALAQGVLLNQYVHRHVIISSSLVAAVVRLLSRFSLEIYVGHVVLLYAWMATTEPADGLPGNTWRSVVSSVKRGTVSVNSWPHF